MTVLVALLFLAQTVQRDTPKTAAISGTVLDAITGRPLPKYTVSTNISAPGNSQQILVTTDDSGLYRLADLPPATYTVVARNAADFGMETVVRRAALAGTDIDKIDFHIRRPGTISGRVLDENKEPVPNMSVQLVSREYYMGRIGYYIKTLARTDDRGEYTLEGVAAGHPYLLLAEKRENTLPTRSDAPLNPSLRRPVLIRTWYPNSPEKEGAQALALRPGERRESVDIELKKSPNFCAEGIAQSPSGPSALVFHLESQTPSSGISPGGGMYITPPTGKTGANGKFRICNLAPGGYRLSALDGPAFGVATLSISDKDITGLQLNALPGRTLQGETILEGPAPATPPTFQVNFSLEPLLRIRYNGENYRARADVPGTFIIDNIFVDDYAVRTLFRFPGYYLKDITYADRGILDAPLRLSGAQGNAGLRVVIAQDGGTISLQVSRKDGTPEGDCKLLLFPADSKSEPELAARMIQGETDQLGQYITRTLAPGKYFVVATREVFEPIPESIARLWNARASFKEVELTPSGKLSVTLQPGIVE